MMNGQEPVTMSGRKGSSVKPGEVENFSITRADNGFTVNIRTKQKPLKKGEMRDYEAGSENEVFTSVETLCARVKEAFGSAKLEKGS